jgi:hypothetical protein
MYYHEEIKNGQLMCRHTPKGAWKPVTAVVMAEVIQYQADEIERLKLIIKDAGLEDA